VLKAAQMASAEPGPDSEKKIHQRHFIAGIEDVANSKKVMEQSIIEGDGSARPQYDNQMMAGISAAWEQLAQNDRAMGEDLSTVIERTGALESHLSSIPEILNNYEQANSAARVALKDELGERIERVNGHFAELKADLARYDERALGLMGQVKIALILGGVGVLAGLGGILTAILR
jgi:uncharacterized protein YicC (UPF0701 family)